MPTLLLVCLLAAPAPLPTKIERPVRLPVSRSIEGTWDGSDWDLTLYWGGRYRCSYGDHGYSGDWSWDPKTNTLHLRERVNTPIGEPEAPWMYWAIVLDRRLTGKTTEGIPVALYRRR